MTTLKTTKDGRLVLVFEKEQTSIAMQIFSTLINGELPSLPNPKRTLSDVSNAVKAKVGVVTSVKLMEPIATPSTTIRLDARKVADEVCSVLFDKQKAVFGTCTPSRLRTFYTELESQFGKPLSNVHRDIVSTGVDVSKYPHRKVDTAIKLLGADAVYKFATEYSYKGA